MLTYERQILFALLVVGPGQDLALGRQPLDQPRAVAAAAIRLPIGGVGTTEAEQGFLRDAKLDVVRRHLERQDRNVDVEEEIEVDMDDLELDRRSALIKRQAYARDIAAPHDPDRALAIASPHGTTEALAVEEALDRRKERDELVVMPFLKLGR